MTPAQKKLRELRDRQSRERGRMAELGLADSLTAETRANRTPSRPEPRTWSARLGRRRWPSSKRKASSARRPPRPSRTPSCGSALSCAARRAWAGILKPPYGAASRPGPRPSLRPRRVSRAYRWNSGTFEACRATGRSADAEPGNRGREPRPDPPDAVCGKHRAPAGDRHAPRPVGTYATATITTALTAAAKAKGGTADSTRQRSRCRPRRRSG